MIIRTVNLCKEYQSGEETLRVLSDINLEIAAGEFIAIMGPSGSGKSTLMNILGLLDVPSSGSYYLHGKDVAGLSEDELAEIRGSTIGFVFQQFHLLPRTTAEDNILMPTLYGDPGRAEDVRILLEDVNLMERKSHTPGQLSGGQQQRVAIARALVNKPSLIFADEPTGNLDSRNSADILNYLRELNRRGITIIMVTHEPEIAAQADRTIVIRDGVMEKDERRQGKKKPKLAERREFPEWQDNDMPPSGPGKWREIISYTGLAAATLAANRIRSFLSMLGILIGVAAVISVLAIGEGAKRSIEESLSSLGSNMLSLRPGSFNRGAVRLGGGVASRLNEADILAIRESVPGVKSLAPSVNASGQVVYRNRNVNTQILGTSTEYAEMRSAKPEIGRFFTEEENRKRARVCIIGLTPLKELFGSRNPIGEMVKIDKVSFQIIGILPEKGGGSWRDQDDIIIIPVQTAMRRLMGRLYYDSIDIEMKGPEFLSAGEDAINNLIAERKKLRENQRDEYRIRNMADIQAAMSQTSATLSLLLSFIAAISLLVGGIGIMNIMLVSVTERTKEIGLRKAVGARRYNILLQFLTEAVLTSIIGGFIGVITALVITLLVGWLTGWQMVVTPFMVILALSFSFAVGVLFGFWPARKASRLHPIDALRYE